MSAGSADIVTLVLLIKRRTGSVHVCEFMCVQIHVCLQVHICMSMGEEDTSGAILRALYLSFIL